MDNVSEITWHGLQELLRNCTDEAEVLKLMEQERKGQNRVRWLQRMQGRFSVLRRERENRELGITKEG